MRPREERSGRRGISQTRQGAESRENFAGIRSEELVPCIDFTLGPVFLEDLRGFVNAVGGVGGLAVTLAVVCGLPPVGSSALASQTDFLSRQGSFKGGFGFLRHLRRQTVSLPRLALVASESSAIALRERTPVRIDITTFHYLQSPPPLKVTQR